MLTGQSPLGELLAAPSTPRLDLAVCLVDVADRDRWIRLGRRDPGVWTDEQKRSFIEWARWHRSHVADPRDRPEVLTRYPVATAGGTREVTSFAPIMITASSGHRRVVRDALGPLVTVGVRRLAVARSHDRQHRTHDRADRRRPTCMGHRDARCERRGTLPLARGWEREPHR